MLKLKTKSGWYHVHGTSPNGQRIRKALKTRDRKLAEEAKAALETKIFRNHIYGKNVSMTFDECALEYVKTGHEKRFILKLAAYFQGRPLDTITGGEIIDAGSKIYPKVKNSTVNRQVITPAQAIINFGHERGWCRAIKVNRLFVPKSHSKAVNLKYILALLDECNPYLAALVIFLNQTGRRLGEAISISDAMVDYKKREIYLPKTKNGEGAVVIITSHLAAVLKELPARNGKVFGYNSRSAVRHALLRATKRAGIEYLSTHQIGRHSFATTLAKLGWHPKKVATAGGWKSTAMVTEIYTHLENEAEDASNEMAGIWQGQKKE